MVLSLWISLWIRAVTKLLEDLVFFVVDIPNSGQDVLEIMVNKPNRERQKLMREQNILKQVSVPHDSNGHHFQASHFDEGVLLALNTGFLDRIPRCRSSNCCRPPSQTAGTDPC